VLADASARGDGRGDGRLEAPAPRPPVSEEMSRPPVNAKV
jgi:hypothetical protein